MPLTPEGKQKVNEQYQDLVKVLITVTTASLVLPIAFLKNIVEVKQGEVRGNLAPWGYLSWIFLLVSLLLSLGFYFCSTKLTKALNGDETVDERRFENLRDGAAWGIAISFFFGTVCLLTFFWELLEK